MTWTSTKDPGRFAEDDAEVEVLVDLEPFRLSAVDRATGRGFRTCDAKSVSANRLGGLRPEEAGAPVVYRVGAEICSGATPASGRGLGGSASRWRQWPSWPKTGCASGSGAAKTLLPGRVG